MPQTAAGYVHRIGRTGGAYNTGASVSLVSPEEMENFEEIKSISGEDGSEDSKFIAPFPLLSKNDVESLQYRAANRSWTTSKSTAKTAMLDLEKIPTLDTHPIPFVSDKPLTYGGAVGSPS